MRSLLLGLTVLFASCGYHWYPQEFAEHHPTIAIPFVKGDEEGIFTNEMARALTASGLADLRATDADYRLEIAIVGSASETIDWRKDRLKVDGKNKRTMVASESRKILTAQVTLFRKDEEIVFGPCEIEADTEFDYLDEDSYKDLTFVDLEGVRQAVLPFSLGQLEAYESAHEAALHPLYSNLAQKIIDVLSSKWHEQP